MAGKKIPTKIRCSADSEAIITTRVGSFELQDKAALTDRYCNYSYRGSFFFYSCTIYRKWNFSSLPIGVMCGLNTE